ncbi:MAG TPA: OsmC family protein [Pirellulaceae bacterium]|jgi:putative redox protein|nr:OsmC family protein [Pirellulaceae bacterium]
MSAYAKDAVAVWKGGTAFEITSGSGYAILTDGDAKSAQSPMELVLAALIGCTGADVIEILRKKRQDVTSFEIRTHGERSDKHPRVYTEVHIMFVVTGRGIDSEAVRRAIELSETKYCSVSAMMHSTAKFTIGFEIHEAEPLAA